MSDEQKSFPEVPPPPPGTRPRSGHADDPAAESRGGSQVLIVLIAVAVAVAADRWLLRDSSPADKNRQRPVQTGSIVAGEPGQYHSSGWRAAVERAARSRPPEQSGFSYNYDYLLERDSGPGRKKGRPFTYNYERLLRGESSVPVHNAHREQNEVSRPQLVLSWREATPDLLPLIERLTPQQRVALGLTALASGSDVYAAHVYLINAGDQPVQISPQKLRMHIGYESARVFIGDDPRFLKATVLHRGQRASGLVMFAARTDIGAAIRQGAGEMSYIDPAVEMIYR